MKKVNKLILSFLLIILFLSFCSCTYIQRKSEQMNEDKIYQDKVDDFFNALKEKDEVLVKSLFSENAKSYDLDLDANINYLFDNYSNSEIEILYDNDCMKEGHVSFGKFKSEVSSTFPVIINNVYYYVYFDLTYHDDFDIKNIGITQINFYSSDEYFVVYHSEEKLEKDKGLNLFIEKNLNEEVKCINKFPFKYKYINRVIKVEEVLVYLKNNDDIKMFIKTFGDYNCKGLLDSYYYEVVYNNEIIYLELVCDKDKIIDANLCNDRMYIKNII